MKITWHGHSVIEIITNSGKNILIDPFIKDNPLTDLKITDCHPDYILLTHAHHDHVGDTLEIARQSGAKVIAIVELAKYFAQQGVPTAGINFGGSFKEAGLAFKLVPAWHTATLAQTSTGTLSLGNAAGFELHIEGKVLYDAGDTALFSDMQLINQGQGVDLAFLPIGDYFTMGIADAQLAASFVKARRVLPIHYNTFPQIKQDPQKFIQGLAENVGLNVKIGQTFEL
ncbi:metal-dependent hydrolase [Liquorilactobacillus satsumensis]|uniref:UPF0173 metal-dependent hydrolase FD50_GL001487 n=1 Tax=Liquorilactobacillus satsumensis DSM 16230 = JCM 12392 TaxID=1423801 RepID=A0A0R1UWT8_9LACO|nr:metal-dependent hydrolase [Liquorilactobacillus satsumensis]KRL97502.1 metal-dependent hydrolase [Liquorilactobacillus satsumensis DSM 16230 = JCM 12392]MCP9312649.1 metal-dependent hydrolase [Liquorilactobacillus satsumensis]MCP9327572.1 metal-dependent hydrolase [Liquorilactobacillus satsumensis]MCP9359835.1 metal-dependent hydrolase [Liquorilactobacillus satsumensis]